MKQSNSLYNNEAIAVFAIGLFLKIHKTIEIPKILFVLPFILHEPTLKKIRSKSYMRSLEEFVIKNPECIINFNSRFLDNLPLTTNSITILNDLEIIRIEKTFIHFNEHSGFNPPPTYKIGKRAQDMFKAIEGLSELMKIEDVNSFYIKLKIEL